MDVAVAEVAVGDGLAARADGLDGGVGARHEGKEVGEADRDVGAQEGAAAELALVDQLAQGEIRAGRLSTVSRFAPRTKRSTDQSDGYDQIIYGIVDRNIQPIPAAVNQDFHQQPGRSLVAIDKTVVADHAVKHGCSFARNTAMKSRVGAR